jgi:hypothetical protein
LKTAGSADGVDSAQGASKDQQIIQVVELWWIPAATRKQREAETLEIMQGAAVGATQRCNHRNVSCLQFQAERVFFKNLLI